jgi:hypothetical protein
VVKAVTSIAASRDKKFAAMLAEQTALLAGVADEAAKAAANIKFKLAVPTVLRTQTAAAAKARQAALDSQATSLPLPAAAA